MVNGISEMITPEVFKCLYDMGHMDELSIVDANYSASSFSGNLIRLPITDSDRLLYEILKLMPIDEDNEYPLFVFKPDHMDQEDPAVWGAYRTVVDRFYTGIELHQLCRGEFYDRTRRSYATISTQDKRLYANIVIRKGIILA